MSAAVVLGSSVLAPSAWADTFDFNLAASNLGAGFTGPFVAVDVNRTSTTTAILTFTSLTNGGFTYLLSDGSSAAANINASSFSISSCCSFTQISGGGFSTPTFSIANPPLTSQVDGAGRFNAVIDSSSGYDVASSEIDFTVTNLSGTWATAASVLTPNPSGNEAAAHVFACVPTCTLAEGATATGFASVPGPIVGAGIPGLIALGATGLLGLARRRRNRSLV
jgi:hypothetical protein